MLKWCFSILLLFLLLLTVRSNAQVSKTDSSGVNLKEVNIVRKRQPVVIKKDTVEYDAAFYGVDSSLMVEELLKRMPGMEIGQDGSLKHENKEVYKLRVNGKDFFTGNVKEFIRRLPVGIVAKIQIIDDYGDHAVFTGIKTKNPQKMINIVTKNGINSGKFAGAGINAGNNSKAGLDVAGNYWLDEKQISFNTNLSYAKNTLGVDNSSNFSTVYNDKISDKIKITSNYRFDQRGNNSSNSSFIKTITPLGEVLNSSIDKTGNKAAQQLINSSLIYSPGEATEIRISPSLSFSDSHLNTDKVSHQTGIINQDLSADARSAHNSRAYQADFSIDHRFKKEGRSLSLQGSVQRNQDKQANQVLNTIRDYLFPGDAGRDSVVNLLINENSVEKKGTLSLDFREPLTERSSLQFNFSNEWSNLNADFKTGKIDADQTMVSLDSLSNHSMVKRNIQNYSLSYNYTGNKMDFVAGINLNRNLLENQQEKIEERLSAKFNQVYPTASFNYLFNSRNSIKYTYTGQGTSPAIMQLQLNTDDTDIQNRIVGNPALKPSFEHTNELVFRSQSKNNRSFLIAVSYTIRRNMISLNKTIVTDPAGITKQQTSYVNLNGSYSVTPNYSYTIPLKLAGLPARIGVNGQLNYSNLVTLAQGQLNSNKILTITQSVSGNIDAKQFSVQAGAAFSNTSNQFAMFADQNLNVRTMQFNLSGDASFFKQYKATVNALKRINAGYTDISPGNPLLINLGLERKLFHNNQGTIGLQISDLLNQNNNAVRSFAGNSIIDEKSVMITRYFIFSFHYNLSNFAKK
ncbi:outer membrane receptor protein involved in Fe transport [Pedobacter cryoconitis]|uniref:Outer membrane receptor protein involved in Fe transport n=1 Tax=Pedobacter cryoconitis TaxID=188932 RepID=A0A7W9DJX0_9SPHI|nr:outer membrane beta-barrel protein [Pedobacter cryoconitis]MBB5620590.1 outer membrane receptor protein involved in Fe transport [Pedobacter cryoconitis]